MARGRATATEPAGQNLGLDVARSNPGLDVARSNPGLDVARSNPGLDVARSNQTRPADFDLLYRREFAFVWRVLRYHGVEDGSIEDAVQDVFMILYRRWEQLEFPGSARPWLFGAARRVAAAHRRKADRHQRRVAAAVVSEVDADLHDRVASRHTLARLQQVLAELDDRLAVVFVLADIEGQTGPEIAELLGIKLNSIYSRLRTARARVQAALASPDEDPGMP
jgi:RNA polymerase sigma factor (sigma-70 family)